MNHRIFVAFLLNFALASGLTAQDPSLDSGGVLIPEQACFDVLHYSLELTVDPAPERRRIDGCLTMTAKMTADAPVIALHLDSVFEVSGVSLRTGEATWRHDQGLLRITGKKPFAAGRRIEVKIHYGGRPRVAKNPPWNGGFTWSKSKSGQPWIATSCQGQGADLWWPCKDHPSDKPDTMHLAIRVPEGLFCATNGVFTGATTKDGWKTFRWDVKNPISNYCVALNIGPYVRLSTDLKSIDGTTTIPIHFWVLPEDKDRAERILPQFVDHLRWFEKTLGPYPFRNEKYGIVQTPHLGMEHQTIIAYGNRFMGLRGGYDWLHHHELSHEWWGNLVTCRDWKDMWIHEGFGTYMQAMYLEELRGRAAYDNELAKNRVRMVNKKAVAPRTSKSSNESYFASSSDSDIYFKGAWILHSLRWLIGDATFRQCLREFCYPTAAAAKATDGSQTRFVSTQDFIDLVNRKTGKDLGWFFELYLRQPELPRLASKIVAPGKLRLSWETPEGFDFPMPVPLRIGKSTKRVAVPKGGVTIDVVEDDYAIDPEGKLFRKTWQRKRLRRGSR